MITIGIVRETKVKTDNRTPIVPNDVYYLTRAYKDNVRFFVQPSDYRCFSDSDYKYAGAVLSDSLKECDFIFGVKEVRPDALIQGKHYFFFGHIREDKPYEYPLLHELVNKRCTLSDYELFDKEHRVAAFSYFAGLVGAYNAIRLYGLKNKLFDIPPAQYCGTKENV